MRARGARTLGGAVRSLGAMDTHLCRLVRTRTDHSAIVPVGQAVSLAGEHAAMWLATAGAGALLDRRRRSQWLLAAGAVAGAHGIAVGVKRVIRRPRPDIPGFPALTSTASGLSFPSAHGASSTAAAVVFSALLPRRVCVPLAAATCASRVLLGAHYPSDVLVGAAIGAAVGGAARRRICAS